MQARWLRINTWIRKQPNHVDFAAALGGDVLAAAYDSGDGLHPNDAGYAALAQVVDLWTSHHAFRSVIPRPPPGPLPRR
jgi:lysophospholipase L1-like esterase